MQLNFFLSAIQAKTPTLKQPLINGCIFAHFRLAGLCAACKSLIFRKKRTWRLRCPKLAIQFFSYRLV